MHFLAPYSSTSRAWGADGQDRFLILNMHLTGRIAPTREFLMLENSVLDGLSQKSKPNTYF
jgi:hypothetical protein